MSARRLLITLEYCKPLRTIERDSGPFLAEYARLKNHLRLRRG